MPESPIPEVSLFIDGQYSAASTGRRFERRNPLTGDVASIAAAAGPQDAAAAAAAAAAAFPAWSQVGPNARRAILLKAAGSIEARAGDFVKAMAAETGATEGWARFNVNLAASMIREAASLTTQINGEVIPSDKPGCVAMAVRQPVGVILGIAPWNAPVILGVRAIVTALACGNTAILKTAELCPWTQSLIGQAFFEAGLPPGVLNILSNAPIDAAEIVGALIDHPMVRRVNFTGSTRVGRIIAQRAAAQLKPVLLELGGKAPLLVLDDADLDEAVKAAAFGAFFNQGQICMSTERVVVDTAVADTFVAKFVAKAATLVAGDPREARAPLGSVVDASAAAAIQDLIDDAVAKGAVLHLAAPPKGTLLSAAILDRVTPEMRIYAEESFGPVTTIVRVNGEKESVDAANDTRFGLAAAVFTRDVARGLRVAGQIQSGICHINGPTVHDEAQMPFGGVKDSGYGRFGGKAGIDSFTELRWITIETRPGHYPI